MSEAVLVADDSYCVLSPHSDDAALSIAGTMKLLVAGGKRVTLVTCFSKSSFSTLGVCDVEAVSNIRKNEDVAFINLLSPICQAIWIDLPDAPLRGVALDALFVSRALVEYEEALARELADRLRTLLPPASTVFLPLGIGSHVDHLIVREAALSLMEHRFRFLAFYEDLPYASPYSLKALNAIIKRLAQKRGWMLQPFHVWFPGMEDFKRAAMACYTSQGVADWVDATMFHAAKFESPYACAERVWKIESARSSSDGE
jgi:LmbE family N-acetylglucosaminyl deacetylase